MQQKYFIRWPGNNFGDNLNNIIFPMLGVNNLLEYKKHLSIKENTYLGLGSIIGKRLNKPVTVLGSGIGSGLPNINNLKFGFVRGKITCKTLGIEEKYAIGDTAYYLKDYMQNLSSNKKTCKVGIIPHHKTKMINKNLNIIHPSLPVEDFIKRVSECEYVLCEAMHGAICADILRVPFAAIQINNDFNRIKWNDWASVLDINLDFGTIDNYNLHLSSDQCLEKISSQVKINLEKTING